MLIVFHRVNYISFRHLSLVSAQFVMKDYKKMPPSRANPVIKTLDNPLFHSLFSPELNELVGLFKKYNHELKIAGGAVRDILMDIKPRDLDFATNATPDEMKDMFEKEGVRIINNRGEKHGTITPRINNTANFEITTLRIDKLTNGRHAEVEFTKDWKLDALRRDLTINSMFLDFDGRVFDYFYGYDDLQQRRVAFVGNAEDRIREDYLRILRYFRFYGRIAVQPDAHEESTIRTIQENVHGLEIISGERIWSEWLKILSGNFAMELTLKMLECNMARYIGLPEQPNIENTKIIYQAMKENNISLKPITFIATMLKDQDEVLQFFARLKVTAYERDLALFFIRHWGEVPPEDHLKFYKRILIHSKENIANVKSYICELLRCKQCYSLAEEIEKVEIPRFPVSGHILKQQVKKGKTMGIVIRKLKDIWLDSNFEMNKEELLQQVPQIVSELENVR